MNAHKRIALSFLSLFLFFSSLTACTQTSYTDTVSCETLADRAIHAVTKTSEFAPYGEDHLRHSFSDASLATDYRLLYSVPSENIDEIGILHAKTSEDAKQLLALTEQYLQDMRENDAAFIASYAPEELPKLTGAKAERFGNYVAYAILSEEHREAFFRTVQEALTEASA